MSDRVGINNLMADGKNILIKDIFEGISVDVKPLSNNKINVDDLVKGEKLLESVSKMSKGNGSVLGIIEGVYFMPDGYSRNRRFYPKELWENVIQKINPVLQSKGVLGTLEHPEDDKDAHPRNASHVVKRLWIGKDGKGYGKSYLLNTPIGSLVYILGTALDEDGKPLVPLFMSSRGLGRVSGYTQDGYEVVDPATYILETFDIVLDPGFSEARPELKGLVESVIPEATSMSEERVQFFFSIIQNLEEEGKEEDGEEMPTQNFRPEGFMEEAYPILENAQPVIPVPTEELEKEARIEGLPTLQMEEVLEAGARDSENLNGEDIRARPGMGFVEIENHDLSHEDLKKIAKLVESEVKENQEDAVKNRLKPATKDGEEDSHELSIIVSQLKSLVSNVETLRAEIEGLKATFLEELYGISKSESRRILESFGGNLDKARKKLSEGLKGRQREKDRVSKVVIERASRQEGERDELNLLESILERL